jgi:adenosylcobinamide-GDP ribazoletransferase
VSAVAGARLAVGFLTIVPAGRIDVASGGPGEEAWLSRAAAWFPVVGALVGGAAGGVVALAGAAGLTQPVAGALGLVAAIVLTRGLHEDGLADTADGLGVHGSRERRLAAMKDSAVGAHGALAMASALLVAALALTGLDAEHALRALVAAHVLARAAMVLVAAALPNARSDGGLGRSLAVAPAPAAAAAVLGVAGAIAAAGNAAAAAVALATAAVLLGVAVAIQARAFGGRTGDTLGATGKLVEVGVLVALAGAWGA